MKIGARMVRRGRYITFQLAEVAVSRRMFGQILARIARLRTTGASLIEANIIEVGATGEVCLGVGRTEVERDESGYGCGPEGSSSVFSHPINEKLPTRAWMATVIAENDVHPGNVGQNAVGCLEDALKK